MNGKIPETISETIIWVTGIIEKIDIKITNIETQIAELKKHPDNIGKWLVRIFIILNSLAMILLLAYTINKGV